MIFDDLVDAVIRKSAAIERLVETGNYGDFKIPDNKDRKGMNASFMLDQEADGKLSFSKSTHSLLNSLESYEAKIRSMKLNSLPKKEQKAFIDSMKKKLIQDVESAKRDRLMELLKETDRLKAAPDKRMTNEKLYDLEMSKLRIGAMSEQEKYSYISKLRNSQKFSESEILLLANNSGDEIKEAAFSVLRETPPYLSDENGRKVLNELKSLVDTRPGEFTYSMNGNTFKKHIVSMLDAEKMQPTINDLDSEGISLG